jgi:hypothetical protein
MSISVDARRSQECVIRFVGRAETVDLLHLIFMCRRGRRYFDALFLDECQGWLPLHLLLRGGIDKAFAGHYSTKDNTCRTTCSCPEKHMANRPPLTDAILVALARLVDDSQTEKREPSHSDIEFRIDRVKLSTADPSRQGKPVGKSKRVRGALSWALSNDVHAGEMLVAGLIATVQGYGGFRQDSTNFCGAEAIASLASALATQGWELTPDGAVQPQVLASLAGKELTTALRTYARRAQQGSLDDPLLAGTAKDLLEATAIHVLMQTWGTSLTSTNFPTLLGQAFTALGLATASDPILPGELAHKRVERAAYDLGCALNALRNKEGTGHGRPWSSRITPSHGRFAIESMGSIALLMLDAL